MREAYSLDDVLLEPQYSNINSRLDTDVSTWLADGQRLNIPIIATNMSSISGVDMVKAMYDVGGMAILHRFMPVDEGIKAVKELKDYGVFPLATSIGVGGKERERGIKLLESGADTLLIDIAHGHSEKMGCQIKFFAKNYDANIIAGNVSTYDGAKFLMESGADVVRVGIGPGARCTTRTVTGHGVPNLTALEQVVKARSNYFSDSGRLVRVILDGGIKNSGDIVKALYFGADTVCLGNLLSGTDESPGEIFQDGDKMYKKYYGEASVDAQDYRGTGLKPGTAPEGFSAPVEYKGSVKPIVDRLVGGIRSGLTYSGARNIEELRLKGKHIYLSLASQSESKLR